MTPYFAFSLRLPLFGHGFRAGSWQWVRHGPWRCRWCRLHYHLCPLFTTGEWRQQPVFFNLFCSGWGDKRPFMDKVRTVNYIHVLCPHWFYDLGLQTVFLFKIEMKWPPPPPCGSRWKRRACMRSFLRMPSSLWTSKSTSLRAWRSPTANGR